MNFSSPLPSIRMRMHLWGSFTLAFLSLALLSSPASAGYEQDLAQLAKDLAETLEGLGEDQVLVGQFTGPAVMQQASAGAGIAKVLSDAFREYKITISRKAKFAIQGSYKRVLNQEGRPQVIIRGEFENNRTGESFGAFEKALDGSNGSGIEHLTTMFGVSTSIPTDKSTKQREQTVLAGLTDPMVHVENTTRLRTSAASPYAIEILTWKGRLPKGVDPAALAYRPTPIKLRDGFAFAPIDRGDVYAIRLINDSPREAAISVSIDGLGLFSFADQKPAYIILAAKSAGTLYGWYRNSSRSDALTITSYADSAVSELGASPRGIGLVTATFRQAWRENESIPNDEFAAKMLASRGENATGRGVSVQQHYQPWMGYVGAIREVISVRYQHADEENQ